MSVSLQILELREAAAADELEVVVQGKGETSDW